MSLVGLILFRLKMLAASPLRLLLMVAVPVAGVWAVGALAVPADPAIPVALVDLDRSGYSALVAERFSSRPVLQVRATSAEEAARLVQTAKVEAAVVLERGFEQRVRAGDTVGIVRVERSPASLSADLVGEYVASEVTRLVTNTMAADMVVAEYQQRQLPVAWQEVWDRADRHWQGKDRVALAYRTGPGAPAAKPHRSTPITAVYGLLASLALFNSLLAAGWIIEERNTGLFRRLATTATHPERYLLGSALAMTIVGAVTGGAALAAFRFGLHWPLAPGPVELALAAAYLVAITGLAILVSALLKTDFQLQAVAPLLTLVTGVAGTGGGSLAEWSSRLQQLALATPQGWLLYGLSGTAPGRGLTDAALPLAVLAGGGVATALLGWGLTRLRSDR